MNYNQSLTSEEIHTFKATLHEYGLGVIESIYAPYLERTIGFKLTVPDNYDAVGNTRFGGIPDLPSGIAWPQSDHNQKLIFLMQISLDEISQYQDLLPSKGMLYFFYASDDLVGKVLYFHNIDSLKRYELNLPDSVSHEQFASSDLLREASIEFPHHVEIHTGLSIPASETFYIREQFESLYPNLIDLQEVQELHLNFDWQWGAGPHQMFGYGFFNE